MLARREHARAELRDRLLAWVVRTSARSVPGHAPTADADDVEAGLQATVDQVLDELHARGLLNEARAAESLVAAKAGRFGQNRLRQLMQRRHLPEALVSDTLQQLKGSELERSCEVWRKRFGVPPRDAAERARQFRFLLARGFDADTAARTIARGSELAQPDTPSE